MTIEEILKSLPLLVDAFTEEELQEFTENVYVKNFKRNDVIYSEGETPSELFMLLSGKVKIYKEGVAGRSQIVRVVNAVDLFGYRACFSNQPFITAAAAFEPCAIACVPLSYVKKVIQTNAKVSWMFIQQLARTLGDSDNRTVTLTQKHIRGRLAENILYMKERYGVEEDGRTLDIQLSREDLANLSNMTTSNAIRTLSLFAQEGLVTVNGRKITILDEAGLRRVSRMG